MSSRSNWARYPSLTRYPPTPAHAHPLSRLTHSTTPQRNHLVPNQPLHLRCLFWCLHILCIAEFFGKKGPGPGKCSICARSVCPILTSIGLSYQRILRRRVHSVNSVLFSTNGLRCAAHDNWAKFKVGRLVPANTWSWSFA